jgi:hypothetical protein
MRTHNRNPKDNYLPISFAARNMDDKREKEKQQGAFTKYDDIQYNLKILRN